MKAIMSSDEQEKYKEYLLKSSKIFEFGSGGSTVLAASLPNIETIHSVDSNAKWINKVDKQTNKKVIFHYIDINSTSANWGFPKDRSKIEDWPKYSEVLSTLNYRPNLVFVDGRFRVACALKSIKNMEDDSYLVVHDYLNRSYYHVIEKFFEKIDEESTLCIFKKRQGVDNEELDLMISKHEKDPR